MLTPPEPTSPAIAADELSDQVAGPSPRRRLVRLLVGTILVLGLLGVGAMTVLAYLEGSMRGHLTV